jgi:hypothetical protein
VPQHEVELTRGQTQDQQHEVELTRGQTQDQQQEVKRRRVQPIQAQPRDLLETIQ